MISPFKNHNVHVLDKWVRESTITEEPEKVIKYICYFLAKNKCKKEVKEFLLSILFDKTIINKTTIVNNEGIYETVLTISPNKISTKDGSLYKDCIKTYKKEAEIIFLNFIHSSDEKQIKKSKSIEQGFKISHYQAKKEKDKEKVSWEETFEHWKSVINDMLYDFYNYNKSAYETSENKKYKTNMNKAIKVLKAINKKRP